jgi:nucleoid-associated protein YgaU
MTERGLPIADGAPACPFVAFEDERDERATSPDHRHRCYAEPKPAPRALAHQEAYCLSSAFPVCPTFQDWARREAARSRPLPPKSSTSMDAVAAGGSQRNPPRNWAAPPPWLAGEGGGSGEGTLWEEDDDEADVPPRGRGLSGSYADRVASDATDDEADDFDAEAAAFAEPPARRAELPPPRPDLPPARPEPWDDEPPGGSSEPVMRRRRERDAGRPAIGEDRATGGPGRGGGSGRERHTPAPEWERAKPLETYPTLRSRALGGLTIPPILVGIVALALAAAVLFALPGLLGFGSPSTAASPSPTTPVITAIPSVNPTPVPQPTPVTYTVQAGDTLSRIAGRFGITLQQLIDANKEAIPDPDKLQIGDVLIIPVPIPTALPAASEIPDAT